MGIADAFWKVAELQSRAGEELGKGLIQGTVGLGKSVQGGVEMAPWLDPYGGFTGGVAKATGEAMGREPSSYDAFTKKAADYIGSKVDPILQNDYFAQKGWKEDPLGRSMRAVGAAAPSLAMMMGTAPVVGTMGALGLMGAIEAAPEYTRMRADGLGKPESLALSTLIGAGTSALEALPFHLIKGGSKGVLSNMFAKHTLKKNAGRTVKAGGGYTSGPMPVKTKPFAMKEVAERAGGIQAEKTLGKMPDFVARRVIPGIAEGTEEILQDEFKDLVAAVGGYGELAEVGKLSLDSFVGGMGGGMVMTSFYGYPPREKDRLVRAFDQIKRKEKALEKKAKTPEQKATLSKLRKLRVEMYKFGFTKNIMDQINELGDAVLVDSEYTTTSHQLRRNEKGELVAESGTFVAVIPTDDEVKQARAMLKGMGKNYDDLTEGQKHMLHRNQTEAKNFALHKPARRATPAEVQANVSKEPVQVLPTKDGKGEVVVFEDLAKASAAKNMANNKDEGKKDWKEDDWIDYFHELAVSKKNNPMPSKQQKRELKETAKIKISNKEAEKNKILGDFANVLLNNKDIVFIDKPGKKLEDLGIVWNGRKMTLSELPRVLKESRVHYNDVSFNILHKKVGSLDNVYEAFKDLVAREENNHGAWSEVKPEDGGPIKSTGSKRLYEVLAQPSVEEELGPEYAEGLRESEKIKDNIRMAYLLKRRGYKNYHPKEGHLKELEAIESELLDRLDQRENGRLKRIEAKEADEIVERIKEHAIMVEEKVPDWKAKTQVNVHYLNRKIKQSLSLMMNKFNATKMNKDIAPIISTTFEKLGKQELKDRIGRNAGKLTVVMVDGEVPADVYGDPSVPAIYNEEDGVVHVFKLRLQEMFDRFNRGEQLFLIKGSNGDISLTPEDVPNGLTREEVIELVLQHELIHAVSGLQNGPLDEALNMSIAFDRIGRPDVGRIIISQISQAFPNNFKDNEKGYPTADTVSDPRAIAASKNVVKSRTASKLVELMSMLDLSDKVTISKAFKKPESEVRDDIKKQLAPKKSMNTLQKDTIAHTAAGDLNGKTPSENNLDVAGARTGVDIQVDAPTLDFRNDARETATTAQQDARLVLLEIARDHGVPEEALPSLYKNPQLLAENEGVQNDPRYKALIENMTGVTEQISRDPQEADDILTKNDISQVEQGDAMAMADVIDKANAIEQDYEGAFEEQDPMFKETQEIEGEEPAVEPMPLTHEAPDTRGNASQEFQEAYTDPVEEGDLIFNIHDSREYYADMKKNLLKLYAVKDKKIADFATPRESIVIISGGQTGADRGGLEGARDIGLKTGGTAPKGFKTETGSDKSLASFNLKESSDENYLARTEENIKNSDGTVIFADDRNSPGTRRTIELAKKHYKPITINPSVKILKAFVRGLGVINVAGNRESKAPGLQERVRKVIKEALAGRDSGEGTAYNILVKEQDAKMRDLYIDRKQYQKALMHAESNPTAKGKANVKKWAEKIKLLEEKIGKAQTYKNHLLQSMRDNKLMRDLISQQKSLKEQIKDKDEEIKETFQEFRVKAQTKETQIRIDEALGSLTDAFLINQLQEELPHSSFVSPKAGKGMSQIIQEETLADAAMKATKKYLPGIQEEALKKQLEKVNAEIKAHDEYMVSLEDRLAMDESYSVDPGDYYKGQDLYMKKTSIEEKIKAAKAARIKAAAKRQSSNLPDGMFGFSKSKVDGYGYETPGMRKAAIGVQLKVKLMRLHGLNDSQVEKNFKDLMRKEEIASIDRGTKDDLVSTANQTYYGKESSEIIGEAIKSGIEQALIQWVQKNYSKRTHKDRARLIAVLDDILTFATGEIEAEEGLRYKRTIVGTAYTYPDAHAKKLFREKYDEIRGRLQALDPSLVPDLPIDIDTVRPELAYFKMLPDNLQKLTVYVKGKIVGPVLEMANEVGAFNTANTDIVAITGWEPREAYKIGEKPNPHTGPLDSTYSPERKHIYREEFLEEAKGMDVISGFSQLIGNYVGSTMDSIQQMQTLTLIGNMQYKTITLTDEQKKQTNIASDDLTLKFLEFPERFGGGKDAMSFLEKQGYKQAHEAAGLAKVQGMYFKVPWVHESVIDVFNTMLSEDKKNVPGWVRKVNTFNSWVKQFVMLFPNMFVAAMFSIPVTNRNISLKDKWNKLIKPIVHPTQNAVVQGAKHGFKYWKGESFPNQFFEGMDPEVLDLMFKHGVQGLKFKQAAASIMDKQQRKSSSLHPARLENWQQRFFGWLKDKGGVDDYVFGKVISQGVYAYFTAMHKQFMKETNGDVEKSAEMAAEFVNRTAGTLSGNVYSGEGPWLSLFMFAKDFTVSELSMLTGAAHGGRVYLNKVMKTLGVPWQMDSKWLGHKYRTGGMGRFFNGILLGNTTQENLDSMAPHYVEALVKSATYRLLFIQMITYALSWFDDDEEERGKLNLTDKWWQIRLPKTEWTKNDFNERMYIDPLFLKELGNVVDWLGIAGGKGTIKTLQGKGSAATSTAVALFTQKDWKGDPISNRTDPDWKKAMDATANIASGFVPNFMGSGKKVKGWQGELAGMATGMMPKGGEPIGSDAWEWRRMQEIVGNKRYEDEALYAKLKNASEHKLQKMLRDGEIDLRKYYETLFNRRYRAQKFEKRNRKVLYGR